MHDYQLFENCLNIFRATELYLKLCASKKVAKTRWSYLIEAMTMLSASSCEKK